MDKKYVLQKLEEKRQLDPNYIGFGVKRHQYKLRSPIEKAELQKLESQFQIKLPDDYRQFILNIGDGGSGPSYGLYSLRGALTGKDRTYKYPGYKMGKEITEDFIRPDELAEDEWSVSGLLILCQHGCANDDFLVINGKERGYVWELVEWAGYIPLLKNPPQIPSGEGLSEPERNKLDMEWVNKLYQAPNTKKMTFTDWYKSWLLEPPFILPSFNKPSKKRQ